MRKFIFLLTSLVIITVCAKAQTRQGNLMAGADLLNITGTFQNGNSQFDLGISPKLGYFIRNNIALGGELDLNLHTAKNLTDFDYLVGAFGRYYFSDQEIEFSKRSLFFLEANVGFTGTNTKIGDVKTSTNGLGIGFGPGIAYFITPNVGLETLLKYNLGVGFGNSVTTNKISLNLGFQIYLPTRHAKRLIEEETK